MQRVRLLAGGLASFGVAVLAGCASHGETASPSRDMPALRLAPALLGHPLALQQHIVVDAPGHRQEIDVMLEADARHVQLAVVALGQVAARLDWDGATLTEDKAPWWPQAVSGARILGDLQLTLWPLDAIRAALPADWQLAQDGEVRTLSQDGEVVTVITHPRPGVAELDQRREHFHLTIESHDAADAASAPQ